MSHQLLSRFAACLVALLGLAGTASAQHGLQGLQSSVPSAQVLGMGGATVAFPTSRAALFYNPAQLTRLRVSRSPVALIGVSAASSTNLPDQIDFFQNRLEPALADGIDRLGDAEEQALYDDVFQMGTAPTLLNADVILPSFVMNRESYGVGGGVFAHSAMRYRVEDAGAGVPAVDFAALADLMAVAAGSADLSRFGVKGLNVGAAAKYTKRYISLKSKPLDAFNEGESVYVMGDGALAMDFGLLYDAGSLSTPGKLYLGLAASDLFLSDFDYQFATYYVKLGDRDDAMIEAEAALARERYQTSPSFRAGLAYVLPTLAGPLKETAFAFDYVDEPTPTADQPFMGHLRLGMQTTLGKVLSLRAGLNQGYTTFGAGLQLSFVQLDYAYFGTEEGRLPGQAPTWHHRLQIVLGSF